MLDASLSSNKFLATAERFFAQAKSAQPQLSSFSRDGQRLSVSAAELSYSFESVSVAKEQGGRKVLGQSVQASFSQTEVNVNLGVEDKAQIKPASLPAFEPPSPKEVANRILGFVEARISAEKEAGADEERLADLLSQARKGVEQGFSQALDDIEGLGLLSEDLQDEIDESFSLVNQGLDDLEARVLGNDEAVVKAPESEQQEQATPVKSEANQINASERIISSFSSAEKVEKNSQEDSLGGARFAFDAFEAKRDLGALSILTQDGDKVSISFGRAEASRISVRDDEDATSASINSISVGEFEIRIEGDLDEDELVAIEELLNKVDELSSLFFSGDFEKAFEAALSIGFDGEEIAAFSLNLQQTQYQEVAAYREVAKFDTDEQANASEELYRPLTEGVNLIQDALSQARLFDQPLSLLDQLLSQFNASKVEQEPEKADYFEQLNAFLDGVVESQLGSL